MPSLQNVEDFLGRMAQIKRPQEKFFTNLYSLANDFQSWFDAGEAKYFDRDDSLILLRSDRNVIRLYHVARNESSLAKALASVSDETDKPLVTELIGRESETETAAAIYHQCRFHDYTTLLRMTRTVERPDPPETNSSALCAKAEDLFGISEFLERVLDPLRDHMPGLAEIEKAIAARQILVEKSLHEIRGVLLFESTAASSILRYWYVDPAKCNQGVGGRLMKEYLRLSRGKRRISLWVVSDNQGAIEKYQHYGFQFDGLSDRIMTRSRRA